MEWTEQRIEMLRRLWGQGQTASQIAVALGGVTRNAVIGKAHRLGLTGRPSPIKRDASGTAVPKRRPVPRRAMQPQPRPMMHVDAARPAGAAAGCQRRGFEPAAGPARAAAQLSAGARPWRHQELLLADGRSEAVRLPLLRRAVGTRPPLLRQPLPPGVSAEVGRGVTYPPHFRGRAAGPEGVPGRIFLKHADEEAQAQQDRSARRRALGRRSAHAHFRRPQRLLSDAPASAAESGCLAQAPHHQR